MYIVSEYNKYSPYAVDANQYSRICDFVTGSAYTAATKSKSIL